MSTPGQDWDRAREVVEPAVDMVAAEILAAGVNPGLLGAALVVAGFDHEEIKGFMAAMIMGYKVAPVGLLRGLEPGGRVRFTIDADKEAIVKIISRDE